MLQNVLFMFGNLFIMNFQTLQKHKYINLYKIFGTLIEYRPFLLNS